MSVNVNDCFVLYVYVYVCINWRLSHTVAFFDREARAPTVTLRAGTEKEKKMKEKNIF